MAIDGLGALWWFPAAGTVLAVVALLGAVSGVRRAVVAVLPVAWILVIVFLPAFGLGLLVAPAALGATAAAAVPDRPPAFSARRGLIAVLWAAIVVLLAAALLVLSAPVAA